MNKKKLYVIIDAQQIEGKSIDESSPHYWVNIWLEHINVGAAKYHVEMFRILSCLAALGNEPAYCSFQNQ